MITRPGRQKILTTPLVLCSSNDYTAVAIRLPPYFRARHTLLAIVTTWLSVSPLLLIEWLNDQEEIHWSFGNPEPGGPDNLGTTTAQFIPLKLLLQYIVIIIIIIIIILC